MIKVYVDGQVGTTGLKIHERLQGRSDVELLRIDEDKRKDLDERKRMLNMADVAFLCLPDAASIEAVSLVENPDTVVIDASTAHRTNPAWAYGIPELSEAHKTAIKSSKRISVPGCYATAFTFIVYPLIAKEVLPRDIVLNCFGLSGYSGAGKTAIEQYSENPLPIHMQSPRMYALGLTHKHIPEMMYVNKLTNAPIFLPVINNFFSGMTVSIPLTVKQTQMGRQELTKLYSDYYAGQQYVKVLDCADIAAATDNGFLPCTSCNDTNNIELRVLGNDEQILLTATLDNLGKGASGAAVQVMDLVMN